MDLKYKPDFDIAREYWRAFWNREIIDRPCICVLAPKNEAESVGWPKYMDGSGGDYEKALERYENWASAIYFGGESIPCFETCFGPDQFSAFLGAKLVMANDMSTSWVEPFVGDFDEEDLRLNEDGPYSLASMKEFIRIAAEYSKGKFLVSMLDLHSGMDCLSAVRGPENLCMDLLDCPDKVEKAMQQVQSLYVPVYEGLFDAGMMSARGSMGWAPTYCEGKFAVVQCDFSCMISTEHMKRFVIPAIIEEASYLDHCVYHYDGKEALRHLDDILAIPEIDVIQWVPGAGQPRTLEWMDLLKKIQKAKKGLWIYDWTIEEIKQYHGELRPEGVVYQVGASSQKEAEDFISWMKMNT